MSTVPVVPTDSAVQEAERDRQKRRRERRLAMNRMTACKRRRHQADLIEDLKRAVENLKEKNARIREDNEGMKEMIENYALEGGGGAPPSSPSLAAFERASETTGTSASKTFARAFVPQASLSPSPSPTTRSTSSSSTSSLPPTNVPSPSVQSSTDIIGMLLAENRAVARGRQGQGLSGAACGADTTGLMTVAATSVFHPFVSGSINVTPTEVSRTPSNIELALKAATDLRAARDESLKRELLVRETERQLEQLRLLCARAAAPPLAPSFVGVMSAPSPLVRSFRPRMQDVQAQQKKQQQQQQ